MPFSLFSVPWFFWMCQLSNRHGVRKIVNDFSFGEVQWVTWVQSVLCESWCNSIIILKGLSMLCQSMSEGPASLSNVHFGVSVTTYVVHKPLLLVQWYWVFGVYQQVAEGAQWTKDHLDVRLCEDPSYCLRETIDVGQGYSWSRLADIHFLSA